MWQDGGASSESTDTRGPQTVDCAAHDLYCWTGLNEASLSNVFWQSLIIQFQAIVWKTLFSVFCFGGP